MSDDETLAFYAREAKTYASRGRGVPPQLDDFLASLPPGARILELGTGGGHDARTMLDRGFDVQPSDASPELAAEAAKRLGRDVAILRFDQLEAEAEYDGVWAHACLLHAPRDELTDALTRIHRALKPGGHLVASFKTGDAEGKDSLGRYFNYVSQTELAQHLLAAGHWASLAYAEELGSGYDRLPTKWIWASATR